MRLPLPLVSFQKGQASTSRLINCFAEKLPADAKAPLVLTRVPGVATFTTAGDGPIRGLHFSPALDLVGTVTGGSLYKVSAAGTATSGGSVGAGGVNTIDIDDNGSFFVVVNEPAAYSYDGTTFATINDADFTARGAGDVEFLDNYMLFRDVASGRFFGSDLGSVSAYDALNFATAEGSPDNLVGLKVDHRQAGLFGSNSLELWENTGISGFPFERSVNGFIEIGCAAGRTIVKGDNSMFWVASDFTVRRLEGNTPVRISDHQVEKDISAAALAGTLTESRAYFYTQNGHLFYVLTLPTKTWVLDVTTGLWHERQSYGQSIWLPHVHCQAFGKQLVGSATTNKIGYLDPDTYNEWGEPFVMSWTYQPIYAEGNRAFHDRLEIVMDVGVGLTTGQGSAPEIMLEASDDGGKTWRFFPNKSPGALGKYGVRVVWSGLGSSYQRVYRASVSDPVSVTIHDTQWHGKGGRL